MRNCSGRPAHCGRPPGNYHRPSANGPTTPKGCSTWRTSKSSSIAAAALEQLGHEPARRWIATTLREATLPSKIHATAQQFAREGAGPMLETLRRRAGHRREPSPGAGEHGPGKAGLSAALPGTLGDRTTQRACRSAGRQPDSSPTMQQTAAGDADLDFQCGLMAFEAGRTDAALASWRSSLTQSSNHRAEILRLVGGEPDSPGNLEKLLPDSPTLLIELAREEYSGDQYAPLLPVAGARGRVDRAAWISASRRAPPPGCSFCPSRQKLGSDRKLHAGPGACRQNTAWRYELALLLRREGKLEQAHEEAKYYALIQPANADYRKLLEEINHARDGERGEVGVHPRSPALAFGWTRGYNGVDLLETTFGRSAPLFARNCPCPSRWNSPGSSSARSTTIR